VRTARLTDLPLRCERASVSGTPVWLNLVDEPIYAVLHESEALHRNVGVLMLPMFGWDDSSSYRARREWASAYAEAGFPTVRFDLPGTGDSGGSPLAPSRFESWIRAVTELARWLRETSGVDRVVAVGLGLGGLLAGEAIRSGAVIDGLVLWAVPSRGRAYMRELRMYAQAMAPDGSEPERPDGALSIGGYLLSKETADAISAANAQAPGAAGRAVLLIERDTNGVDDALHTHFVEGGADVTVVPCDEYSAMMTTPDWSRVPSKTIAAAVGWLEARAEINTAPRSLKDSPAVTDEVCFEHDGEVIRERHVRFDTVAGSLVGILSEPMGSARADLCLIAHNPGAIRRTGICRIWTDMCRRWSARGLPALRVDIEGVGDSDGRFVKNQDRRPEDEERIISSRIEIADTLEADHVASRFVSVGHCLGAYWESKISVRDPRVIGVALVNPGAFDWTREFLRERERRSELGPLRDALKSRANRSRLLTPEMLGRTVHGLLLTIRGSGLRAERGQFRAAVARFNALSAAGTRVLMLFSTSELVYLSVRHSGLLKMLPRWPQIELEELPSSDHDLRSPEIQTITNERIDRFLEELLAATVTDSLGGFRAQDGLEPSRAIAGHQARGH